MPKEKKKIKVTHQKIVGQKKEKVKVWVDDVLDDLGNIVEKGHHKEIEVIKNIVEDVTEEIEVEVEETEQIELPKSLEERVEELEKVVEELKEKVEELEKGDEKTKPNKK